MGSVHVKPGSSGGAILSGLRLPYATGPMTPAEVFRRRAAGATVGSPRPLLPSDQLTSIRVRAGDAIDPPLDHDRAVMCFVIAGHVELTVPESTEPPAVLTAGDTYLAEAASRGLFQACATTDAALLCAIVGWSPADSGGESAAAAAPSTDEPRVPKLRRMYEGDDNRSYFTEFPQLFDAEVGSWGRRVPLRGMAFVEVTPGDWIDWHPEVVNNLVFMTGGELELEVGGGGGRVEVFAAGDVCLAEDRTGEGHIDRMPNGARFAIMVVPTENLW